MGNKSTRQRNNKNNINNTTNSHNPYNPTIPPKPVIKCVSRYFFNNNNLQQLCVNFVVTNQSLFPNITNTVLLDLIWNLGKKSLLLHNSHDNLANPMYLGYRFHEDISQLATNEALETIANNHNYLLYLAFHHCLFSPVAFSKLCVKTGESLTTLKLHMCDLIMDVHVAEALKYLPNLEKLVIGKMGAAGIESLYKHCPKLRIAEFNWGIRTMHLLNDFVTHLPYLEYLSFQVVREFGDPEMYEVAKCKNLRTLYISCCSDRISTAALVKLAEGCTNLRTFHFSNNGKLTDEALFGIAQNLTQLEELRISGYNITDEGMRSIGRNCPKLSKLYVSNLSVSAAWLEDFMPRKLFIETNYCDQLYRDIGQWTTRYVSLEHKELDRVIVYKCKKCEHKAAMDVLW